jgi:cytochrome c oxidase subunit 2
MRGTVVVEDEAAFQGWLKTQPTFAALRAGAAPAAAGAADSLEGKGKSLAQAKGCVACHSVDGSPGAGPTWKGLYGKTEAYTDGSSQPVDEAVLKREIGEPAGQGRQGLRADHAEDPARQRRARRDRRLHQVAGAGAPTVPGQKAQR